MCGIGKMELKAGGCSWRERWCCRLIRIAAELAVVETSEWETKPASTSVESRADGVPVAKWVSPSMESIASEAKSVGSESAESTPSTEPTDSTPWSESTQSTESTTESKSESTTQPVFLFFVAIFFGSCGGGGHWHCLLLWNGFDGVGECDSWWCVGGLNDGECFCWRDGVGFEWLVVGNSSINGSDGGDDGDGGDREDGEALHIWLFVLVDGGWLCCVVDGEMRSECCQGGGGWQANVVGVVGAFPRIVCGSGSRWFCAFDLMFEVLSTDY